MRGFVRTAWPVLVILLAIFHVAEAGAAERRVVLSPNSDYRGFDLETLKSVDLKACEAACIGDQTCRAFTFNERAGWCFLKTTVEPMRKG